jgi:Tol biopolymer transport system component
MAALLEQAHRRSTNTVDEDAPGGGADQEILGSEDAFPNISCSSMPGGSCVLVERQGKTEIVSLVDPIKGRGSKILEMTGEPTGDPMMSPDGNHIAFVLPGAIQNRIRIMDLHGVIENEVTVPAAEYLTTLDWSADGAGFFSGDLKPSVRLLHIQRDGASQVVWAPPTILMVYGMPSPDGRHLVTFCTKLSANVWMVENP